MKMGAKRKVLYDGEAEGLEVQTGMSKVVQGAWCVMLDYWYDSFRLLDSSQTCWICSLM